MTISSSNTLAFRSSALVASVTVARWRHVHRADIRQKSYEAHTPCAAVNVEQRTGPMTHVPYPHVSVMWTAATDTTAWSETMISRLTQRSSYDCTAGRRWKQCWRTTGT